MEACHQCTSRASRASAPAHQYPPMSGFVPTRLPSLDLWSAVLPECASLAAPIPLDIMHLCSLHQLPAAAKVDLNGRLAERKASNPSMHTLLDLHALAGRCTERRSLPAWISLHRLRCALRA